MKNLKLLFLLLVTFFKLNAQELRLGIIDTAHTARYRYQPFFDIIKTVGFDIEYISIAQLADKIDTKTNKLDLNFDEYDGILFILEKEILQGKADSILILQVQQLIENFAKIPGKLVAISLPSVGNPRVFAPILNTLGIKGFPGAFFLPFEARNFSFDTTLKPARTNGQKEAHIQALQSISTMLEDFTAMLPIKKEVDQEVLQTFPYGFYAYRQNLNNHIFLTYTSLLSFAGITENFQICPTNFEIRNQMYNAMQQMMWELYYILNNFKSYQKTRNEKEEVGILPAEIPPFQIPIGDILVSIKPEPPEAVTNIGQPLNEVGTLRKTAWMDIKVFEDNTKTEEQEFLIDAIFQSGEDLNLWIVFNPQTYYSPVFPLEQNTQERFWSAVSQFTEKLKVKADKLGVGIPKILVGFEICHNFRMNIDPETRRITESDFIENSIKYYATLDKQFEPATNIYGQKYLDIPAPTDELFWKNEIQKPLEDFLLTWAQEENSHGISISGVVLDLEMYMRKISIEGSFTGSMGFNTSSIRKFNEIEVSQFEQEPLEISDNIFDNIQALIQAKKTERYFDYLQAQAVILGKNMRTFFNNQIRDCIIACYAQHISIDWFYKGFYEGLSASDQPLQLLTFNSEFKAFNEWLQQNNIYIQHSSVLMLSKLKSVANFMLVDEILRHHHGIWLNRFRRFAEFPENPDDLEYTPMTKEERIKFFNYLKML
jgi:hypothetical protein